MSKGEKGYWKCPQFFKNIHEEDHLDLSTNKRSINVTNRLKELLLDYKIDLIKQKLTNLEQQEVTRTDVVEILQVSRQLDEIIKIYINENIVKK